MTPSSEQSNPVSSPSIQVDFYILNNDDPLNRIKFVCRLCDKLQKLRKSVTVAMETQEQVQLLDRCLWEFPPESFLAHETAANSTHIQLSSNGAPAALPEVFINMCSRPFDGSDPIARVVEVVNQEADVLAQTRKHFKFYRDRGYPIQSHPIN